MYASDARHSAPALEEKLTRLYRLNRHKNIDLGFRPPYLELLRKFGNPHLSLPPVVHVAGTNGKGSVVAFMRAALETAGYSVHVYTSPHLQVFNERVVLAGQTIGNKALEELIDEATALNEGRDITFFEITTALAFAAYARTPADILLLETGLGGRLDCTNIIEAPLAAIITNISYDHMEHLGETLHAIAGEKAGIIKKSAPCVTGPQGSDAVAHEVMPVLNEAMNRNNSKPCRHGSEWFIEPRTSDFRFLHDDTEYIFPNPGLPGVYQIANAGTAIAALKTISRDFKISDDAITEGLHSARWPARLQQITNGPLTRLLPPGWELFLDGGHNSGAADMLARQAKAWQDRDGKSLHLVLAMMDHKNPAEFVGPVRPFLETLHAVPIPGEPKALPAAAIAAATGAAPAESIARALQDIVDGAHTPGRILIAGSLYQAGQVLKDGHK